jgi:hypothetical protein
MKFGFIGAGNVAKTVSRHVLPAGHTVLLSNSRGPETLADLVRELGAGAAAGTPQQAADQDVVVLSVPWWDIEKALAAVPDWSGRVLVDATNRIDRGPPMSLGDISGRTSSEIVADHAPGAKVVKAFNNVPMAWIEDVSKSKPATVLFLSGDDPAAKGPLQKVLEDIGFACIDLGSLAAGGRLQQLGGPLAGVNLTFHGRFSI